MKVIRWHIIVAFAATALSLFAIAPGVASGGLTAWLLVALVIGLPISSGLEAAKERRAGRIDVANILTRWTMELAIAIGLVVYFDSLRLVCE